MKTGIFCFLLVCCQGLLAQTAPTGLMVNFLRLPEEVLITDSTPVFCWIPGKDQKGYQIVVAEDSVSLFKGGTIWDTNQTMNRQSCNIEYEGKELEPFVSYFWSVRTWSEDQIASDWATPQKFIIGSLEEGDGVESEWQNKPDGKWRLEDRQRSNYVARAPESLWEYQPGHFIADFGKAAFATLQLSFDSKTDGDTIRINLAERGINGLPYKDVGKSNIGYKETFLISKSGFNTYTVQLPRHISHYPNSQVLAEHMPEVMPYRYAEIIGVDQLEVGHVNQMALYYYFDDQASHFNSNHPNLNRVWGICKYTLKATPFLSLYMDGNRERMPYEADSYIQQLGHYSVDRDYGAARYTWQFLLYNASWPTEWQTHVLMMAWQDYMYTGNKELLVKHYDQLKRKTLMALEDKNGLISTRTGKVTEEFLESINYSGNQFSDIVDWPPGRSGGSGSYRGIFEAGERDHHEFVDYNTVVNAFYYHGLEIFKRIAGVIGNKKDMKLLSKKLDNLKEVYNRSFFDPEKEIYIDGIGSQHSSLHSNMFPLAFGLVDEQNVPGVIEFIKSRGMACSVYGAQYLLEGLMDHGAGAYAIKLMESEEKRSWMNMINVGSTMTTEAWDEMYKPNLTWNHAWGAAPANILVRKVAGIEPLKPGFEEIGIEPGLNLLEFASFKVPTVRGPVFINWKKNEDTYQLNLTIPSNTKASLRFPDGTSQTLGSGSHRLTYKD